MRIKKSRIGKCIALAMTTVLLTGMFAGCSKGGNRTFPTPTPRGAKDNEKITSAPGTTKDPENPSGGQGTGQVTTAALKPAGSYKAVYDALQQIPTSGGYRDSFWTNGVVWAEDGVEIEAAVPDMAPTEESNTQGSVDAEKGDVSYSETNVQVAGIDEADIIKTDGQYFYVFDMNRNAIYIVSAKGSDMKLTSEILLEGEMGGNEMGREMYLSGNRLVLLVSGFRVDEKQEYSKNAGEYIPYIKETAVTKVFTYDIFDKSAPKLVSTLEQDGRMITSRMTEGKLYVVSSYGNYYGWFKPMDGAREKTGKTDDLYMEYIPMVAGMPVAPDCIYISDEPVSQEFLVVTSMDPEHPEQYTDVKSLLADGDECYVSNNYIYVASGRWQSYEYPYDRTEIYRFAYDKGVITPAGQVTVKGTLDDQFSMDEHNGHLRVVTTVDEYVYMTKKGPITDINGDGRLDDTDLVELHGSVYISDSKRYNSLYIYDDTLLLVGSIENLAPDEHIKSARLMGDVGYFVTFRQTDPLFSVDLSDPKHPKVLGELKIPGFSTYLHPFGEGLLLGIGYDADETTGWTECVKLSMFDVSDPSNVKEVHKHSLTDFTYTGVENDHKAVLIDAEKGIIGFPVRGYGNTGEYNVYVVYSYDEKEGFSRLISEGYAMDYNGEYYEFKYELFTCDCRGAYIGDTFYIMNPAYEMKSYDMGSWEETGRVGFVKAVEERREQIEKIIELNPAPIEIELESNPSTGYTWSSTVIGRSVELAKIEDITSGNDGMLVGTPITQRYTFKVNDIGTTTVTFEYARMWDLENPLKKMVYVITVDENYVAKIASVTEE